MSADDPTRPVRLGCLSSRPPKRLARDEELETLPGRIGARRALSVQSVRLGDELQPLLAQWALAETREERVTTWVEVLEAIAADGYRRREDLERENKQLRGELDQTKQALSLSEEHRAAIRQGADTEIRRLRERIRALGGDER